ncbi:MAG TPA: phosphopentomutase [Halanaerobiales bacterium]|nr:phosphopentomutase [Halanaerobiales bacterium]
MPVSFKKINRITLIVLDSVGIGELPDAKEYGDEGANTLVHTSEAVGGLNLPNLEQLGLGKIADIKGIDINLKAEGTYTKMKEQSVGKDTTTGHWELAGLISENPFPVYPNGFPEEVIDPFEEKIGKEVLGNKPASGTVIIEELGAEHLKTGKPIVYTSADSVFQIAAHEDIIPVNELYEMCETAREILQGVHGVARVIARPFVGELGSFTRTDRRKDFSLEPPEDTVMDKLKEKGIPVMAVGKIEDIFSNKGITDSNHTVNNMDSVDAVIDFLKEDKKSFIFANLVEFDMVYGHRRNPKGYAKALKDFDIRLPEIIDNMKEDDMLIITADHGCDPTFKGTDHTREYVPLLVYGEQIKEDYNLKQRESFADVAATIAETFNLNNFKSGESFLSNIKKGDNNDS